MRKRSMLLFSALLCGVFFLGAAHQPAPVVPTKGFYVNDYASVLFESHRDDLFQLSTDLYERTGVQVVLLTVDSLMGLNIDTYADRIIRDWGVGGLRGEGVLILVSTGDRAAGVYVGGALDYLDSYRSAKIEVAGNNVSKAIMNVYRPMVEDIYKQNGIAPDSETLAMLENPQEKASGPFSAGTVIFLAVLLLAMGRSMRVSRKYRKKYLKGNVRKLRDHTRSTDLEEDYQEKKYRIDYDDMD